MNSPNSHDSGKVIANYHTVSDSEKKIYQVYRVLDLLHHLKKINYVDFLVPFELLYRDTLKPKLPS